MLKLILYGEMENKFGKEHELHVRSLGEAIKAMSVNYPAFKQHIIDEKFLCIRNEEVLTSEHIFMQYKDGDMHLIPEAMGDGPIAVPIVFVLTKCGVSFAIAGAIANFVVSLVISLVFNFIASLLTSTPEAAVYEQHESPEKNPSFLFQGASNRFEQGAAVPILHGQMMVGSHTISSEIRMDNTLVIA